MTEQQQSVWYSALVVSWASAPAAIAMSRARRDRSPLWRTIAMGSGISSLGSGLVVLTLAVQHR